MCKVPLWSDPGLLPSRIPSSILLSSSGVCKLWRVGQNEPTPVFVNKVLLGPWPHPFIYILSTSICNGAHMAHKAEIFAIWPFTIKVCWPMWYSLFFPIHTLWFPPSYLFSFHSHFVECPSNTTQPSGTSFLKCHVFQRQFPNAPPWRAFLLFLKSHNHYSIWHVLGINE